MNPKPVSIVMTQLPPSLLLVELPGEFDLASMSEVRRAVSASDQVIVDLSAASFIDSTIIGALIGAGFDRMVVIVSPPGTPTRRVLETVRAGDLVPVVDTRRAALAMFEPREPDFIS